MKVYVVEWTFETKKGSVLVRYSRGIVMNEFDCKPRSLTMLASTFFLQISAFSILFFRNYRNLWHFYVTSYFTLKCSIQHIFGLNSPAAHSFDCNLWLEENLPQFVSAILHDLVSHFTIQVFKTWWGARKITLIDQLDLLDLLSCSIIQQ